MAGYSGTPLPKKLGIKEGHQVATLCAPSDFAKTLGALPSGVAIKTRYAGKSRFDVIVTFVTSRERLKREITTGRAHMQPAAGFWIAWPKRASGVATDVTEDVVREIALPTGLVDNKVCAIDDTWSALRLVIRKELR
jgi:hypothetical protein